MTPHTHDLIAFLVPSRGRPEAAAEVLESFVATDGFDAAGLAFVVDADDDRLDDYRDLAHTRDLGAGDYFGVIVLSAHGQRGMVRALNVAASAAASPAGDIPFALGFMGDDHRLRTPGMTRRWLDELHDLGTGFVYGDDLLQSEAMPTAVAMTTDIVTALGWMAPPTLRHLNVDLAWLELGRGLDRIRYLPDTVIEHLHPAAGKADLDAGYEAVNNDEVAGADGAAYAQWLEADLDANLQAIRVACAL